MSTDKLSRLVEKHGPGTLVRICYSPTAACLRAQCPDCTTSTIRRMLRYVAQQAVEDGQGDDFAYGLSHGWPGHFG